MKKQLEQRLTELKAEFEAGQQMLADLEAKQANLEKTMLRISGAIQVLEELLAPGEPVVEHRSQTPDAQPAYQLSEADGNRN